MLIELSLTYCNKNFQNELVKNAAISKILIENLFN